MAACGAGFLAFDLVPLAAARRVLPPPLEPVAVLPGRTLGATFFGRYARSPVGPYAEAMRLAALSCGPGGERGFHVPWIVVDSEASRAAGRAHWGFPKALARFDLGYPAPLGRVEEPDGRALAVSGRAFPLALPLTVDVPVLEVRDGRPLAFRATFAADVSPARLAIEAPVGHPARPSGPALGGVLFRAFEVLVGAPG